MSPIKRMTSAFSSAGDRSSRFPGGDMPLQNLKSLYAESPDLPIFTRAVSPCPPRLPPAKPPLPGLLPLLRLSVVLGAGIVGLAGYGFSLVLFVLALRYLGTARTGAYFSTAPFVGAVLAIAMFGDPVTPGLIAAGVLMALGVYLHVSEQHEHEHRHAEMVHEHRHFHDEHHQHAHAPND